MRGAIIFISIALISAALVSLSFSLGLFSGLENFFEDLIVFSKPVSSDIVIVAIDSESINQIGQWPWPREVFARALLKLNKYTPRAVGFDIMLSEPSRQGALDDAALTQTLEHLSYPLVFPFEIFDGQILKPLGQFIRQKNVSTGHVNLIIDKDGVVRKFAPRINEIESFASVITENAGESFAKEINDPLKIVYAAPTGSIRRVPFFRLLNEDVGATLKNKIILIGATAPDLHDEQLTPFSRGQLMPGVEIQANIVNMLMGGYRLVPLSSVAMWLWIWGAALISSLFFIFFPQSVKPVFFNVTVGCVYLVAAILLYERGVFFNVIHLTASWVLTTASIFGFRYFATEKEKREIKNLFSKYVSGDVLKEILKDPRRVRLGGEEKEITVFFSDIRGFTTLSEKTTPSELVKILNAYFTAMSEEILINGGVLDKYIGDAIMAFWGAPIDDPHQADNALCASISMVKKLKDFNAGLRAKGEPEINIGIGLYTGPAVVGNIGSEQRFDYTVIGDTVNVASRLEGLNKEYGTTIIVGESTKNKCRGEYQFKSLGSVQVKGRKEPLKVYTLE